MKTTAFVELVVTRSPIEVPGDGIYRNFVPGPERYFLSIGDREYEITKGEYALWVDRLNRD